MGTPTGRKPTYVGASECAPGRRTMSILTDQAARKVASISAKIETIQTLCAAESRDANDAETLQLASWTSELETAMASHTAFKATDDRLAAAQSISDSIGGSGMEISHAGAVRVGGAVNPFPDGRGWLTETLLATRGDHEAVARLDQFARFASAVNVSDVGPGFAPIELLNRVVNIAIAQRDVLRWINKAPLTGTGLSMYFTRQLTGPSAGVQSAEGDLIGASKITGDRGTIPIVTTAGRVPISWQAVTRSSINEAVIERQVGEQIGVQLERQIVVGSGVNEHEGLLTAAGITVDGSDVETVQQLARRVASAKVKIQAQRGAWPDTLIVDPLWFGLFDASFDTAGRPLFVGNSVVNPVNAIGTTGYHVGTFGGLRVIVSPLLTGESSCTALVVNSHDVELYGGEQMHRFDQFNAANLTVDVSVANLSALGIFTDGSVAKITGLDKIDLEADPESE